MTELELNPHALLFDVRRSIRYHTWRRRFFDGRYRVTTAVAIILGSASVVTVLTQFDPIYPALESVGFDPPEFTRGGTPATSGDRSA